MQYAGEAGRYPLLLRQILRSLLCGHPLCGRQLREAHIEDQRNHNTVDRAHKERPVQKRQSLDKTREAGEGTAGDAGKDGANSKRDDADGGKTGAGGEILPLALAHDPVGGDQHAGQRRDQRRHEGQEALKSIQQAEGCQQRADGAGHTGGDLELALVKAKEIAEGQAAGIGVGNVGGPGGQHQCHKADKRHAQRRKDGGDVILACDDAHECAGQQHEKARGNNAHNGGLHHIAAALGKAAVVGGDYAAQGEGGNHHRDAKHHTGGVLGRIVCDGAAAVICDDTGNETVQADDDQKRHGDVVEPLEALEADAGRQQHDNAPDDRADRDKNRSCLRSQHIGYHAGKGAAAGGRLDTEPANAGNRKKRADNIACALFAQRPGGHHGHRQPGIACLHADADHVDADQAIADQNGQDDLTKAQSASGQHAADHQAGNTDHAARPDCRDGQPALALRFINFKAAVVFTHGKTPLSLGYILSPNQRMGQV